MVEWRGGNVSMLELNGFINPRWNPVFFFEISHSDAAVSIPMTPAKSLLDWGNLPLVGVQYLDWFRDEITPVRPIYLKGHLVGVVYNSIHPFIRIVGAHLVHKCRAMATSPARPVIPAPVWQKFARMSSIWVATKLGRIATATQPQKNPNRAQVDGLVGEIHSIWFLLVRFKTFLVEYVIFWLVVCLPIWLFDQKTCVYTCCFQ